MSSRPAIVNVLIVAIAIFALVNVSGCGQSQAKPAALGPAGTSTPSALEGTVVAQQTTIAQLQSTIAAPTAAPSPLPSDTPLPLPSDTPAPEPSATPAPNTMGAWLIQPVAVSEAPADTGYQTAIVTLTVKNTSSTLQSLEPASLGQASYEGIVLQVKTNAGYLYPQTTTQDGTPMITLSEVPPGFSSLFVATFNNVPASTSAHDLVATAGSGLGGATTSFPLNSLPRIAPRGAITLPMHGYLHLNNKLKQGPIALQILSARLRPYCGSTEGGASSLTYVLDLMVKVTNNYGYPISYGDISMKAYDEDGNIHYNFASLTAPGNDPFSMYDRVTIPFEKGATVGEIASGQSVEQEIMGDVGQTVPISDNSCTATPLPSPPASRVYKLFIHLPPLSQDQDGSVSGNMAAINTSDSSDSGGTTVIPEKWAVYDVPAGSLGSLYAPG